MLVDTQGKGADQLHVHMPQGICTLPARSAGMPRHAFRQGVRERTSFFQRQVLPYTIFPSCIHAWPKPGSRNFLKLLTRTLNPKTLQHPVEPIEELKGL